MTKQLGVCDHPPDVLVVLVVDVVDGVDVVVAAGACL
jgi:hypothetical protein